MSTPEPATRRHWYRSFGAAMLVGVCVAACSLPVLGSVVAGTFANRFLDVPAWAVALVALAAGAATLVAVRRRRNPHGC